MINSSNDSWDTTLNKIKSQVVLDYISAGHMHMIKIKWFSVISSQLIFCQMTVYLLLRINKYFNWLYIGGKGTKWELGASVNRLFKYTNWRVFHEYTASWFFYYSKNYINNHLTNFLWRGNNNNLIINNNLKKEIILSYISIREIMPTLACLMDIHNLMKPI